MRADEHGTPWHGLLVLGAIGEIVVDKLPATPSRTRPFGLLARSGAAARPGIPDVPVALLEDAVAYATACSLAGS
jgi:uncharacterized membrane protein